MSNLLRSSMLILLTQGCAAFIWMGMPLFLIHQGRNSSSVDFIQIRNLIGLFSAILLSGYPQSIVLFLSKSPDAVNKCLGITKRAFVGSAILIPVVLLFMIVVNLLNPAESRSDAWITSSLLAVPPLIYLSLTRAVALHLQRRLVYNGIVLLPAVGCLIAMSLAQTLQSSGIEIWAMPIGYWSCCWISLNRISVTSPNGQCQIQGTPPLGLWISVYSGLMALPAPLALWAVQQNIGDKGAANVALVVLLWGGLLLPIRAIMPAFLVERQRGLKYKRDTFMWVVSAAAFATGILGYEMCAILGKISDKYAFLQTNRLLIAAFVLPVVFAEVPLCEFLRLEAKISLITMASIRVFLYLCFVASSLTNEMTAIVSIGCIEGVFALLVLGAYLNGARLPWLHKRSMSL